MLAFEGQGAAPNEGGQNPEVLNPVLQIRELLSLPPDMPGRFRLALYDGLENLHQFEADPVKREVSRLYAGVLDWSLFGQPGDPLPAGVVMLDGKHPCLDTRVNYINSDLVYLRSELDTEALEAIYDEIQDLHEHKATKLKTIVRKVIEESPEYALIKSFEDQQPLEAIDTPLTPYWKLVRGRQIAGAVIGKHGLMHEAAIPRDPQALNDYRRGLYLLDEETMPEQKKPESDRDIVARVKAYFWPHYESVVRNLYPGMIDTITPSLEHSGMAEATYTTGLDSQNFYFLSYASNVAENINNAINSNEPGLAGMGRAFLFRFLYVTASDKLTFAEMVDLSVERAVDNILAALKSVRSLHSGVNVRVDALVEPMIQLLLQPHGQSADHWTIQAMEKRQQEEGYTWSGWVHTAQFYSKENMKNDEKEQLAYMKTQDLQNNKTRLVYSQPQPTTHVSYDQVPDLRLRVYEKDKLAAPFIPGYTLLYRGFDDYEYVADLENDPYARCDVAVDPEKTKSLAAVYAGFGLTALAEAMRASEGLVVEDLVNLLIENSRYVFNDDMEDARRYGAYETLDDFGKLVRDGKLDLQCTGAATFLQKSLEYIYGPGCAKCVSGFVLEPGAEMINGTKHAQTVFVADERRYMLDATPSTDELSSLSHQKNVDVDDGHAQAPHIEKFERPNLPEISEGKRYGTEVKPAPDELKALENALLENLKIVFGMPDDDSLYKHFVGLPQDDPAKRTLYTLLQYAEGIQNGEDVTALVSYLKACADADNELRRRIYIDRYSRSFLSQLWSTAYQLQHYASTLEKS